MVSYLDESRVRELLPIDALPRLMEESLIAFSTGEVDQPVRAVVDVDGRGFLGVMPAHIRTSDALGAKMVSVFHGNTGAGLPSHMATILLFCPSTGALQAMMDGRYITEVRTAAVSAVSIQALGRPGSSTVAVIGTGVQAGSHIRLLRAVNPRLRFLVYGRSRDGLEVFCRTHDADPVDCAETAVRQADIVVLVTSSSEPVLNSAWVRAGTHVVSVGACRPHQREIDPALLERSRIFVDSRQAALRESGDILMGGFQERIEGELGEVLSGKVTGRTAEAEITVFKSLGLAVEDVACAHFVLERARSAA